jgi:pimeloyl-ACP methyl ester carboxylesterase
LVLLDSTHVDEREPIHPPGDGWLPRFPRFEPALASVLWHVGFLRLTMRKGELTPFEPRSFAEAMKELDYESLLEARSVKSLGAMPLLVLTAGRHRVNPPENPVEVIQQTRFEARWIEAQQQLARLSARGEQRVFPEAGHNLMKDRPRDVLDAIQDVVAQARAQ